MPSDSSDKNTLSPKRSLSKHFSSAGKNTSRTSKPVFAGRASSLSKKHGITKEKKESPEEKMLWYLRGSYVTVWNDEGGWFLCRLQHNVYNTTKSVKIRWLSKKAKRGQSADENDYALDYGDVIDPACILFNVRVTRDRSTYSLYDEDRLETEKLMEVAADVASGKLTCDDVDSDVEEVIQIEPPPKKSKMAKKEKKEKTKGRKEKKGESEKSTKFPPLKDKEHDRLADREPKRKRPTKKDLLILHPNPDVKVWKKDPFFETNEHVPFISEYADSRLVFRAVRMKDYDLLKRLIKEEEKITRIFSWRSVADKTSALEYAFKRRDKEAIELHYELEYRNKYLDSRRRNGLHDTIFLAKLETGLHGDHPRRALWVPSRMPVRGCREGNDALTKDLDDMKVSPYRPGSEHSHYPSGSQLAHSALTAGVDMETYGHFLKKCGHSYDRSYVVNHLLYEIGPALGRGHYKLVGNILKDIVTAVPELTQRIPSLNYKVLLSEIEVDKIPPSNIKHGVSLANMITPVHCAACNPDTKYLEAFLEMEPTVHLPDGLSRRLIHYAAGCETTAPLELLIRRGANIFDGDHLGNTPLHYAARANRANNMKTLLSAVTADSSSIDPCMGKFGAGGINRPNRQSYTPLHTAVVNESLDVVKVLVGNAAHLNVTLGSSRFKLTPLMMAAQFGFFDVAVLLVESGATVQQRDRLGRTAVIHAAMNGNTNVLSYLLHIGASPNLCDNSGNSPLHYAAAYGWYFCVKALLEAGADVNVENDWKTTPLSIAYLKGHIGIVNFLLTETDTDVNFLDDEGLTLVSIAASSALHTDLYDQMQFLIKDKEALCTLKDGEDATPLHHLARNDILMERAEDDALPSAEAMETSVKIAKLLIDHGCDHKAVDNRGMTAAMAAMRSGNVELFKYLVQAGCPVLTDLDKDGDNILHHLCYDHMDTMKDYLAILKFAAVMDAKSGTQNLKKDFCTMARVYCHHGTTPLLAACQQYKTYMKPDMCIWKSTREVTRQRWKFGRNLIQLLIDEFDSDVDAVNRATPKVFENRYWTRTSRLIAERRRENAPAELHTKGLYYVEWSVAEILADVTVCEYGGYRDEEEPEWPELRMLLKYRPNMNTRDCEGHTPLTRALSQENVTVVQLLVEQSNADVNDYCMQEDRSGNSSKTWPLIIAALSRNTTLFDLMIEAGADQTMMSEPDGNTVFHQILIHGSSAEATMRMMQTLLDHGADINVQNKKDRTPLHLAVNSSKGKMDDTFDVILFLFDKGADLTMKDVEGRIPLHYVFFEIGRDDNRNPRDPVELCRIVVSRMNSKDLNIQDMVGKTALHRAAFSGANICCMYLMQNGADINLKDNDGNTALAMAVKGRHLECAALLIQNGARLKDPVVYRCEVKTKEVESAWKWHKQKKENKNEVKKVSLFQVAVENEFQGLCFLIMEKSARESGLSFADALEIGLKAKKYNFVLRLLMTETDMSSLRKNREHGRNLLHILTLTATGNQSLVEKIVTELVEKGVSLTKQDDYKCTPLLYASLNHNFELCRLYMKTPDVYSAKYMDSFRRSVVCAAFWKTTGLFSDDFVSWIDELHQKKANLNVLMDRPAQEGFFGGLNVDPEPDYWKTYDCVKFSPLIIAILQHNQSFTWWILNNGARVNFPDSAGRTPMMHAVRENELGLVLTLMNFTPNVEKDNQSMTHGQNQKQETRKKKRLGMFQLSKDDDNSDNEEDDDDDDDDSFFDDDDVVSAVQEEEAEEGEEEEEEEAEEEDEEEEEEEEELDFKPYEKVSNVNLNAVDKNGWTVMHHAVCPLSFGTFDNDEIVFILAKAGAKLNVKNKEGETPLDLAVKKGAPRIARMIQRLEDVNVKDRVKPEYSTVSVSDNMIWTTPQPSFEEDAERFLDTVGRPMDVEEEYKARIDSHCKVVNGTLVQDEDLDLLYDVLLTKVDASRSKGLEVWKHLFYQMQLVHQRGTELYVLFTRWHCLNWWNSEQYQNTPYPSKEEAAKEFSKLFRQKTGNKWTDVKNFEHKTGKYRLVPNNQRIKGSSRRIIEFENKSTVKSQLPVELQQIMEEMTNMKLLGDSLSKQGLDSDLLSFGSLQRDRLMKAKSLLENIRVLIAELGEHRELVQRNYEQIWALSSEYYHVIPQKEFVFEKASPIDSSCLWKQTERVTDLMDYEVAGRMLLGAKYREKEVNPLDYVYRSLGCQIQLMSEEDVDSKYILKYINSCYENQQGRLMKQLPRIEAIYRLEVEGEQARMDKKKLGNHCLLWHGSGVANFLNILHTGIVNTGQLIRGNPNEGIAFTKLFPQANIACSYHNTESKSKLMLLCEVALGKSKEVRYDYDYRQKLEKGYNSIVWSPREAKHQVRLNTGCVVPIQDGQHDLYYSTPHDHYVYDEGQVCLRYLIKYRDD